MTPDRRRPGLARWAIIGVGSFVFLVFAAVLWYAYVEVMGLGTGGPPPLIRAEVGPIKRAPGDPGGMPVANQGSPAARVLDEEREPIRSERILPRQEVPPIPLDSAEDEEPLVVAAPPVVEAAPPAASPATADPATSTPAPETTPPAVTVTPAPPPESREPPASTPTPAPPPPPPEPAPAPPPAPVVVQPPRRSTPPPAPEPQQAAPRAPASSAPAAGPTYRVQLGAFRNDRAADAAWLQLQRQYSAALGELRPNVVEAQTSDGTFYRLQAGPLAGRDDAVRICDGIKQAGGDCFIVGPLP